MEHEINGYKKLRNSIITVTFKICMKDGSQYTEYVQGVLRKVDDLGIEIEQYLNLFHYLDGSDTPSEIRSFGFREITFLGNLPA